MLEDRLAPSAGLPPDIIVGRTQSAYSTFDVQSQSLSITYTVYNESSDAITGVLLTSTLQPGVTFTAASQVPDQSGSKLAWSLGTIPGYGRGSVSLTVHIPGTTALQLDSGARAFGTLNGGTVTADTPAASLIDRPLPADALTSTADANTSDPFLQEQAARLRYDPTSIFNYLNTGVGYQSYTGSLRGARGTIWSAAGNSLDETSLGVALFRASGIPARYAHGTLSDPLAKQLILGMFPSSIQTVGYIPAGTATADPANEPQLLSETRDHYWLQVDTGNGFVDADTSGLGATTIGTAYTTVTDTFTEVADALRHKVEVKLDAEMYSQASALFGVGNGLGTTTVLDKTFNSVDLVGKPLTVGQYVNQSEINAPIFSSRTTIYSPYVAIGDIGLSLGDSTILLGTDFQEISTNFPFGNQILTGLFLHLVQTGPGVPGESFERAIYDRIGFAARQGTAGVSVSVSPDANPALGPIDTITLNAISSDTPISAVARSVALADGLTRQLSAQATNTGATGTGNLNDTANLLRSVTQATAQTNAWTFAVLSDKSTSGLARSSQVVAYTDRPRLVLISSKIGLASGTTDSAIRLSIDLRRDSIRVVVAPGQPLDAAISFRHARGITETSLEGQVLALNADNTGTTSTTLIVTAVSTAAVFAAAIPAGIGSVLLGAANRGELSSLDISPEAKARINLAIDAGKVVLVPTASVPIGGIHTVGWYEMDPTTGETIGVMEDGGHEGILGMALNAALNAAKTYLAAINVNGLATGLAFVFGFFIGRYLGIFGFGRLLGTTSSQQGTDAFELAKRRIADDLNNTCTALGIGSAVLNVISPAAAAAFLAGCQLGVAASLRDPDFLPFLSDVSQGILTNLAPTSQVVSNAANVPNGAVAGSTASSSIGVVGQISATYTSGGVNAFAVTSLSASASITDSAGNTVGSGTVGLTAAAQANVSGAASYSVTGNGSLRFYGPAEPNIGASGEWDNYNASITGSPVITLNVIAGVLTLNGNALPAGTYTLRTNSATLTGNGKTSSPNFAGSASLQVTSGSINLGEGTGSITVGGNPVALSNGATFDGYTGSVNINADGSPNDLITLNGNAANIMGVNASPGIITTDQNTPASFQVNIATSFADNYTVTAQAPDGWTVNIDTTGKVTVTPAAGLQSGTFPVRVIVISTQNAALVAQATVNVTVHPTLPGIRFSVDPDSIFTVPYNGAEVPTAFRAAVQNLGPTADSYTVSVSNVPAGFQLIRSGTSLAIPAGRTGILGLYLQPVASSTLPLPGTVLTFTVTATSTTDPSITQTQTVSFTMPEIHAVTMTDSPTTLGLQPGMGGQVTLVLQAVGNVAELVNLSNTTSSGLTVTGLPATLSLAPGQTQTVIGTITAATGTPLNTTLSANINATYGTAAVPLTQSVTLPVRVAAPGADSASTAAGVAAGAGRNDVASQLNNLAIALTSLAQTPGDPVASSQASVAVTALVGLTASDADLAPLGTSLTSAIVHLPDTTALVTAITTFSNTLVDARAHSLTLSLVTNSAVAQPGIGSPFNILLSNTGTQMTTYNLSIEGLPAGVTGAFNMDSVTLAPGQSTFTVGSPDLVLTITPGAGEVAPFGFTVRATAAASNITRTTTGAFTARSEIVTVVAVTPTPAFVDPGGSVAIFARILNAVNRQQAGSAKYTLTDSGGVVIFTSQPVAINLDVLTNLSTVALGNLDTTGLATGDYTLNVTVLDSQGQPIPGATGVGQLLVGSPVTASLSTSTDTLPVGSGTITTTLQVNAKPVPGSGILTPLSTTAVSGAAGVVIYGNRAYVAGNGGVRIVDISNPSSPTVLSTFGGGDLVSGQPAYVGMALDGDKLVLNTSTGFNAPNTLLIYSLANPDAPTLVSSTSLTPFLGTSYTAIGPITVINHHVYTSSLWFRYFLSGNTVFGQWGESLVIDITNPANPVAATVVYNRPPEPTFGYPDGTKWPDGTSNVWQIAGAANNTLLVGSTANTKGVLNDVSQLLVLDNSNPNSPSLVRSVTIPGMSVITGIMVNGNTAFVIGSSLGWKSGQSQLGLDGFVVAARLDLTDPRNPVVTYTKTFTTSSLGLGFLSQIGNGLFATTGLNGGPLASANKILVFDTTDPTDVALSIVDVSLGANAFLYGTSPGYLYTTDNTNLNAYQVGTPSSLPATAQVTVPNSAAVVPGSFSLTPTRTTTTATGTTYAWDLGLPLNGGARTITWQQSITGLQPGRSQLVDTAGLVTFQSQGTSAQVGLSDQKVTAAQILGITPPTQTVTPGTVANYTVSLLNPTNAPVTYTLTISGVPSGWGNLPMTVTVAANGRQDIPLNLQTDAFTLNQDFRFIVAASGSNGATSAVQGDLNVQGAAIAADANSHGVVVGITPSTATAGQGTSARYVVRITNTGSNTETFTLSALGLPSGVIATFALTNIVVPPGSDNFREVFLTLTPAAGTSVGLLSFVVVAMSTTLSSNQNTATGTLTVSTAGVSLTLDKNSGKPGDTFMVTITNTGTAADIFKLAVAGPAGLVTTIDTPNVSLAAGQSITLPVTSSGAPFAVQGSLPLMVTAISTTDASIQAGATANLNLAASYGLTATLDQPSVNLSAPGPVTLLLTINNTGNTEDAYRVSLIGPNGPLSVLLIGLDGTLTTSIDTVRLPGLATGQIRVQANLTSTGTGSFSVLVQSLNDATRSVSPSATISAPVPQSPPPVSPPVSPPPVSPPPVTTPRQQPAIVSGLSNGSASVLNPSSSGYNIGNQFALLTGFTGPVRVAAGDFNGDGVLDFVAGAGPGGGPLVMIIDGQSNAVIASFFAFEESFRGGVYLSSADLNNDGHDDIVVTPDLGGGPVVAIYDGAKLALGLPSDMAQINRFFGIADPNFRGGAIAAMGDISGTGVTDLVVTAGYLGGPRISIYNGQDIAAGLAAPRHRIPDFFAFEDTFRNGTFITVGDFNGDGKADIAFGAGMDGGPRVRVISGSALLTMQNLDHLDSAVMSNPQLQLSDFFSNSPNDRGGVRIALRDSQGNGKSDLVVGSGVGESPRVKIYRFNGTEVPDLLQDFDPFNGGSVSNGVFVG